MTFLFVSFVAECNLRDHIQQQNIKCGYIFLKEILRDLYSTCPWTPVDQQMKYLKLYD